jgi:hypothetical protein
MKRLLIVALFAALAVSAFGIDLSAGAGATIGGFSSRTHFEPYIIVPALPIWTYDSRTELLTTVPFAATVYFDATYAMAAFGFRANGDPHQTIRSVDGSTVDTTESDLDERSGFLSFSLLGRYPFEIGSVTLFPLLGIEYDLNVPKAADGTDLKAALPEEERPWLNQFWFKAGAGADFVVYKGLYIRPLVLMGFKLLNQGEKNHLQDAIDTFGVTTARTTDFVLEAGVQAGWRF